MTHGARVPFTLLGGYLGAGKTTLLNRVLSDTDRRLVVLVNDLGAVDVDSALIADHDGATLSLSNGCVCCAIADDFGATLETVRSMATPPDQVLMELSGVAEPARVAPWANTAGFRLDGVVVAADAEQIVEQVARPDVGDTVRAQLVAADLVVLTKTDLVHDGGVAATAAVAAITGAPIRSSVDVSPSLVLDPGVVPSTARPSTFGSGDTLHVVDVVDFDGGTRADLERVLDDLPTRVVRAKGLVCCSDSDAPVEVHVVGRRRTVRLRPDLTAEDATGALVAISVVGDRR